MPGLLDEDEYRNAVENIEDRPFVAADRGTTSEQRLGRITIGCLMINRTVGSGIFVSPAKVLRSTGSVGASLLLWVFGSLFALAGLLVWLEWGLTIPLHPGPDSTEKRSVPRSGGEKNYLEYFYTKPKYLATCMYGIAFIVLGNLSGNAYAFSTYCLTAAGYPSSQSLPKGLVIGVALVALTGVVMIHMISRRYGIFLNNSFAILKVALLLSIIVLGIMKAAGVELGGSPDALDNYDSPFQRHSDPENTKDSVARSGPSASDTTASFADGFVYITYAFSGFEQPFYVLSEFRQPQKRFTFWTTVTLAAIAVLFIATNATYYFVVPVQLVFDRPQEDIAILFFERVFGNDTARRAMAAIIATSIFGNLIVMTFTAARVKQEIAKEGILPKSLFWATGKTTIAASIGALIKGQSRNGNDELDNREQTPMAGLLLHWIFSVLLVAITAATTPETAYSILVSLYSYVIVILVGLFVSLGLVYMKLRYLHEWSKVTHYRSVPYWSFVGCLPAVFYALVNAFLIIMSFIPPTPAPDYSPYYLVPVIGITAPAWGFLWWCGLKIYMKVSNQELHVTRSPLIVEERDKHERSLGTYTQRAELVEHRWKTAPARPGRGFEYDDEHEDTEPSRIVPLSDR